jgi:nucleotide-binding universal stress UspA family protein
MEIRSILVNVGLGSQNAINYAARLAEAYGAEIVGLAAAQPNLAFAGVDGAQVAIDYYAAASKAIEENLARAEEKFRAAVPASVATKWRSYVADTTTMLIDQARRSDIVVASAGEVVEPAQVLDIGHIILACGRPVIMVGDNPRTFGLERVAIAWKDTREARRAVSDALPLLKRAKVIKAVTRSEGDIGAETGSLNDLVDWLRRHGVEAQSQVVGHEIGLLDGLGLHSSSEAPDLVVAGGYGHSRFREWLLGGATSDLLSDTTINCLLSN